ncbi:MAG: thiamine phosphate synthase [Opitutaceae bacterium]
MPGTEPFRLIVLSPEAEDPREHVTLADLFAAGLTSYHLRKPTWTHAQLATWLHALPEKFHPRLVLHTHHDLATEFALGGLHHRDDSEGKAGPLGPPRTPSSQLTPTGAPSSDHAPPPDQSNLIGYFGSGIFRSRAVHDLATLRASLDAYDRLLVSPIFPSFSKPGHAPDARLAPAKLKSILALPRRAEVIALGGIDASRIPACRELGFDGIAVLGAIWQAADPTAAFFTIQKNCGSELARDSVAHREQARSHV